MGKVKRTTELPFMDIEGNKYSKVTERIKFLAENMVYSIRTEEEFFADVKMWKVKAYLTIIEDGQSLVYTGTATEKIGSNEVNMTSALENAETSAVGRACAFAGIGIQNDIASADEMSGIGRKRESVIDDKVQTAKIEAKNVEKTVLDKLKAKR